MRREERFLDRYDAVRGSQYIDFVSKEIKSRTSKHAQVDSLSMKEQTYVNQEGILQQLRDIFSASDSQTTQRSQCPKKRFFFEIC